MSNGHAPSRDIAVGFSTCRSIAHVLLGGLYNDKRGNWIQASESVMVLAKDHPFIKEHLGWVKESYSAPRTARALPRILQGREDRRYSVVARSGDVCRVDSCVLVRIGAHAVWGRILGILPCSSLTDNRENVTIRCYALGRDLHPKWDMPVLEHDDSIIKVPGQVSCIHHIFNMRKSMLTYSSDRTSSSYFRRCTTVLSVAAWKMGRRWCSRNERRRRRRLRLSGIEMKSALLSIPALSITSTF